MADMPNSETAALGLFGMVLQAPAHASGQPPTTASGPSSMELEPSVELLMVLLDVLHSTGAMGTVVGVVRQVPIGAMSISLAETMVPKL